MIPLDQIRPNPLQPRTSFDPAGLQELAASIQVHGVVQPILVQKTADGYHLIAGERRWRAAQMAGLSQIPAVVQDLAGSSLLEVALIENIQREDLNAIELAQALDRLAREFGLSHEEIGRRTGKDRSTITNLIRLLKLPPEVQVLVAERRISMGHARALLSLPTPEQQREIAERAAAQGLSVRDTERLVQAIVNQREAPGRAGADGRTEADAFVQDPNVAAAIRELEGILGTRVRILMQASGRGRIEIDFYSEDDLARIYELLVKR